MLYVTLFGVPTQDVVVKNLGKASKNKIKSIQLLGSEEKVVWNQTADELRITAPLQTPFTEANVYKVCLK